GKAEIKRLWVRPAFRGKGLGRRLAETSLAAARAAGYRCVCLDTLAQMVEAGALYRALGFKEIPGYYDNSQSGVAYLELDLAASTVAVR
ncbi:MAG: GNAT family N-acetyltransferase, partial [Kiloniellales bacterium]